MLRATTLLTLMLLLLFGCAANREAKKEAYYDKFNDQQMYKMALRHVRKKNFGQATETLDALEARYPFGDYAEKAQLLNIYSHYQSDEIASAGAASDRFIRVHPRHEFVDYAYYIRGLVSFQESLGFLDRYLPMERRDRDTEAARKSYAEFQMLSQRFPDSIYTPDAQKRMIYLRNLLAESELVAARYYMKRGSYVAASNRASYILIHYDQTPSTKGALEIMQKAYVKLGLSDLAGDTYRILEHNF